MKPDLNFLGLIIILLFGLWSFLYKYGIVKGGLLPAILATNAVYLVGNLVIMIFLVQRGVTFPSGSTTAILGAATVFGIAASLLFMYALQNHPGSTVIPLVALYPAVAAVLAVVFLKEEVSGIRTVGILMAVAAGYFLSR